MARIAFFQDKLVEKIGVMSIAAMLKKNGHECEMFCHSADNDYIASIIKYNPDIVGCGIMSHEHRFAVEAMRRIKSANNRILTILGGHHPTIFTDIIDEEPVDIICRGEGEFSVLELLESIDRGKDYNHIEGLWVKREGEVFKNPLRGLIQDLDSLPPIDRDIYYDKYPLLKDSPTKAFMISRGCPFQCSFCFNNVYARIFKGGGRYLRFRSPERIIEEIEEVSKRYKLEWVQFHDSTFNSDCAYLERFLKSYIEKRGLPRFICNVRAEGLNERLVSLMRQAGCNKVTVGIQHGKEDLRKKLANRGGDQSDDRIVDSCSMLKKNRIRIYADFIMGWPGETIRDAFESVRFSRRLGADGLNCFILAPLPGTDIQKYSIENGYMDPDIGIDDLPQDITHGNRSVIKQPHMKELINMQKLFYVASQHPWLEPLIRLLIKLPPNKFFSFIHGLPTLSRTLKYDKKTVRSKAEHVAAYVGYIAKLEG